MNDPNASPQAKILHDQTRALVQKAAAAAYGEGMEIVKAAGYWDGKARPRQREATGAQA